MKDLRLEQGQRCRERLLRIHLAPKDPIIDEFGVLPYGCMAVTVLLTVVLARCERRSTALISSTGFAE